jgi:dihydrofolate synthase/folylpolyglutamate synthase
VPIEGGEHPGRDPTALAAIVRNRVGLDAGAAASVRDALAVAGGGATPPRILICGSLYLAGAVLRDNGTPPT